MLMRAGPAAPPAAKSVSTLSSPACAKLVQLQRLAQRHVPAPAPLLVDAQREHRLIQHEPVDRDLLTQERQQAHADVEARRSEERFAAHVGRSRE